MRSKTKWIAAGTSVIGVTVLMAVGAGAAPIPPAQVATVHLAVAGAATGAAGAQSAATAYAGSHYPGQGTTSIVTVTPDVEHGVPVYDARLVAPDGRTYVVHVLQSNDTVLSANLAEKQVVGAGSTVPPVNMPPVNMPPVSVPPVSVPPVSVPPVDMHVVDMSAVNMQPESVQAEEPAQVEGSTHDSSSPGTSVDTQGTSGSMTSTMSGTSTSKKSDG